MQLVYVALVIGGISCLVGNAKTNWHSNKSTSIGFVDGVNPYVVVYDRIGNEILKAEHIGESTVFTVPTTKRDKSVERVGLEEFETMIRSVGALKQVSNSIDRPSD